MKPLTQRCKNCCKSLKKDEDLVMGTCAYCRKYHPERCASPQQTLNQ